MVGGPQVVHTTFNLVSVAILQPPSLWMRLFDSLIQAKPRALVGEAKP